MSKKMSKKTSRKSMKGGSKRKTVSHKRKTVGYKRKTVGHKRSSIHQKAGAKTVLPIVSPGVIQGIARIYDDDNIGMIKLHAQQNSDPEVKKFGSNWDQIWKDFSRPVNKQAPPRYQVGKSVGNFLNEIKGKSLLKNKGKTDNWDLS